MRTPFPRRRKKGGWGGAVSFLLSLFLARCRALAVPVLRALTFSEREGKRLGGIWACCKAFFFMLAGDERGVLEVGGEVWR